MRHLQSRLDRLEVGRPLAPIVPASVRIREAAQILGGALDAYVSGQPLERCMSSAWTWPPGQAVAREALARRIATGATTVADEAFLESMPTEPLAMLDLSAAGYVCLVADIFDDEALPWASNDGPRMDLVMQRVRAMEARRSR